MGTLAIVKVHRGPLSKQIGKAVEVRGRRGINI
jgi:hypothetical protein